MSNPRLMPGKPRTPPKYAGAIACIADVHLGNHAVLGGAMQGGMNERCLLALGTLDTALLEARRAHADAVTILGDLFDGDRPSPMLVTAVMQIFQNHIGAAPRCPIVILTGNHDVHSHWEHDNAVAPLEFLPSVTVISAATTCDVRLRTVGRDVRVLAVPHMSGVSGVDALTNAALSQDGIDVLAFHAGVKDEHTPPWLAKSVGAVDVNELHAIMCETGAMVAVCGDWHDKRVWQFEDGRVIVQCGSLCPTGFDDTSTAHGLTLLSYTIDGSGRLEFSDATFHTIAGPRFVTSACDTAALAELQRALNTGSPLYVDFKYTTPDEYKAAEAWVREVRRLGTDVRAKYTPRNEVEEVETAPTALPSAPQVPEMISAFVRALPPNAFEHGATPKDVEARAIDAYRRAKKG